jgi:hypothetical protein
MNTPESNPPERPHVIVVSTDMHEANLEAALGEALSRGASAKIVRADAPSGYRSFDPGWIIIEVSRHASLFQAVSAIVTTVITVLRQRHGTVRVRDTRGNVVDVPGNASPDTVAAVLGARHDVVEHVQAIDVLREALPSSSRGTTAR